MGSSGARPGMKLAGLAILACHWAGLALADARCTPGRVDLRWDGGRESFIVEVADEPVERSRGLKQRDRMDLQAGMLFVYEKPTRARFWMKDTLIPLDLIFADATGLVTRVHANAVPLDVTSIDGGTGVRFVLEINGGLAAKLGITAGAQLRHPAIGAAAVWPCAG